MKVKKGRYIVRSETTQIGSRECQFDTLSEAIEYFEEIQEDMNYGQGDCNGIDPFLYNVTIRDTEGELRITAERV